MTFPIPPQNVAIFLQKFVVTAPTADSFSSSYASVGVVTTNSPGNRQWQFTWNGSFSSTKAFQIIYDFSAVDTYGYNITFEGNLNGFLTVDGQIYAADKYITYIPQTEQDILDKIVRIRFKPPCRQPLRDRSLYYVLNLNDGSCNCKESKGGSNSENYITFSDKTQYGPFLPWTVPGIASGTYTALEDESTYQIVVNNYTAGASFGFRFGYDWYQKTIQITNNSGIKGVWQAWIEGESCAYLPIDLDYTECVEIYGYNGDAATLCLGYTNNPC
jgi:hypothetical protein